MKKIRLFSKILFLSLMPIFFACSSDDDDDKKETQNEETSKVIKTLQNQEYRTLTEYKRSSANSDFKKVSIKYFDKDDKLSQYGEFDEEGTTQTIYEDTSKQKIIGKEVSEIFNDYTIESNYEEETTTPTTVTYTKYFGEEVEEICEYDPTDNYVSYYSKSEFDEYDNKIKETEYFTDNLLWDDDSKKVTCEGVFLESESATMTYDDAGRCIKEIFVKNLVNDEREIKETLRFKYEFTWKDFSKDCPTIQQSYVLDEDEQEIATSEIAVTDIDSITGFVSRYTWFTPNGNIKYRRTYDYAKNPDTSKDDYYTSAISYYTFADKKSGFLEAQYKYIYTLDNYDNNIMYEEESYRYSDMLNIGENDTDYEVEDSINEQPSRTIATLGLQSNEPLKIYNPKNIRNVGIHIRK